MTSKSDSPNPEMKELLAKVEQQEKRCKFLEAEVDRLRKLIRDMDERQRNQDRGNGHV